MAKPIEVMLSLSGKTALVTGAGSGIGRSIARLFAQAGAHVICVGRTAAKLEATIEGIKAEGDSAEALMLDVADEAGVETAFAALTRRFGGLDVLVNNAAVMTKHDFLNMRVEAWDAAQSANLRSAFVCTREAVKLMRGRGGAIVNVASVAALHASVHGNAAYGASKAGLLALTRSVALEFAGDGIRCNAVLPGAIATEGGKAASEGAPVRGPFAQRGRILLGRIGRPEEVAAAALYLASDASSYVTGQTLIVDGGLMIG